MSAPEVWATAHEFWPLDDAQFRLECQRCGRYVRASRRLGILAHDNDHGLHCVRGILRDLAKVQA